MRLKLYICALHAALLALVLSVVPAPAGQMSLLGAGKASGGGGCTPGTEASTFLARTSGLNGTETAAYCVLINGLVADSTWTLIDALYIHATNTTTTANLNLKSTSFTLTQTGTCTFTADRGYACNGSTGFLDTAFTPSSSGTAFTLDSASLGSYIRTSRTTDADTVPIGVAAASGFTYMQLKNSGNANYEMNGATFPSGANANAQGLWIVTRTTSTATALYKNGNTTPVLSSGADTSVAAPNLSLYISAYNNSGTAQKFSDDQTASTFIGGGLSSANMALIASRINAYMQAVGADVY